MCEMQADAESASLDILRSGGRAKTASREPYWSLIQRNESPRTASWPPGMSTRPAEDGPSTYTCSCGDPFVQPSKTDTSSSAKLWSRLCGSDTIYSRCIRKTGYRSNAVTSSVYIFQSTIRYRGLRCRVTVATSTCSSTTTIFMDRRPDLLPPHRQLMLLPQLMRSACHARSHSIALNPTGIRVVNIHWMPRLWMNKASLMSRWDIFL